MATPEDDEFQPRKGIDGLDELEDEDEVDSDEAGEASDTAQVESTSTRASWSLEHLQYFWAESTDPFLDLSFIPEPR
jgi:hypothetical protein